MPDDYGSRLSREELDDLVSYLVNVARNKNKPRDGAGMKTNHVSNRHSLIDLQVQKRSLAAALRRCLVHRLYSLSQPLPISPPGTFKLTAESPAFWKLFDRKAKLTQVAGDFGFTEGPVWDESGFLYVSDEEQNKIYRVFLDGRKQEVISLGDPGWQHL